LLQCTGRTPTQIPRWLHAYLQRIHLVLLNDR
jgi:hypothetical protein